MCGTIYLDSHGHGPMDSRVSFPNPVAVLGSASSAFLNMVFPGDPVLPAGEYLGRLAQVVEAVV